MTTAVSDFEAAMAAVWKSTHAVLEKMDEAREAVESAQDAETEVGVARTAIKAAQESIHHGLETYQETLLDAQHFTRKFHPSRRKAYADMTIAMRNILELASKGIGILESVSILLLVASRDECEKTRELSDDVREGYAGYSLDMGEQSVVFRENFLVAENREPAL